MSMLYSDQLAIFDFSHERRPRPIETYAEWLRALRSRDIIKKSEKVDGDDDF